MTADWKTIASRSGRPLALAAAGFALSLALLGAGLARADSTPIGSLPAGPSSSTTTKSGQLFAVALPKAAGTSGLVWRVARPYDASVVKELSEGDVGTSVVIVYKVVGRGDTSIVYALTRGDTSSKAVKSVTYKVHST